MTAFSFPDSMRPLRKTRSSAFGFAMPPMSFLRPLTKAEGFRKTAPREQSAGIDAPLLEGLHARGKRNLAHGVENEIVRRGPSEILLGIVNHVIRAERFHQCQIRRTTNPSDLCPEVLGKLYRSGAHRSGCSIDEDLLTALDISFSKEVQRR